MSGTSPAAATWTWPLRPWHALLANYLRPGWSSPAGRRPARSAGSSPVAWVADRVLFPGWIPREQVPLYVAAADISVNPYRDTLINRSKCAVKGVIAMAMGKAIVSTRVGQNLEYIENGHSGLLTERAMPTAWPRRWCVLSNREWRSSWSQRPAADMEQVRLDLRAGLVESVYQAAQDRAGTGVDGS